jgi:hypothetical protein
MSSLAAALRRHGPALAAVLLLWALCGLVGRDLLRATGGHFAYTHDDPYIHMAMAKNLARHGVFGVTADGWSSSTSSPLWTALLALAYLVTGVHELTPLVLDLAAATALVLTLAALLRRLASGAADGPLLFGVLGALVLCGPLPALVFSGMEHVPALLAAVLLAEAGVAALQEPTGPAPRRLLVVAALAPLVRYELLFVVGGLALLFALRRRWRAAALLVVVAAAPVTLYGLASLAGGAYFFPSSVLLKRHELHFDSVEATLASLGYDALDRLKINSGQLAALVLVSAGLYVARARRHGLWEAGQLLLALTLVVTLVHAQLAAVGSLHRYEAYLFALFFLALGVAALAAGRAAWGAALAACVLVAVWQPAFLVRLRDGLVVAPQAAGNIYRQQKQMAEFLSTYYDEGRVAANDIGAVSFFTDVHLLDIWGLGSIEVTRLKHDGGYGAGAIASLAKARGTQIAITYEHGLNIAIPREWKLVGRWTIPKNVICASDTVAFWAVDAAEESALRQHLREFGPRLPADVKQSGPYTENL